MATVKDVAKLAGVSAGTVSRVFNGNVKVNEETREKVVKAAKSLSYVPDIMARSLKIKETKTIGILVPEISSEGFVSIIKAIETVCFQKGYSLIVCNSEEDNEREAFHIKALLQRRIDGMLICPVSSEIDHYDYLYQQNVPMIFLTRMIEGVNADVIKGNDHMGCYDATKYLLELGHQNIGVISKPEIIPFVKERIQGFKDAFKDFGLQVDDELIKYTSHLPYDAMKQCEDLVLRHQPSAIFAMSHSLTISLIKVIQKHQLTIPDDISVIGYGESEWNTIIQPSLTMVELDGDSLGKMAIEKLVARIVAKNTHTAPVNEHYEKIIFPANLRERKSCRALKEII